MHVIELLPAYALGVLDEDEMLQVSEHLADCAACRVELRSFEQVTDRLAFAAPDASPPARLKQEVMEQVQPSDGSQEAGRSRSLWQRLAHTLQATAPVWGLASLVLIVGLVISNVWWWQQASQSDQAMTPGEMQFVAMVGTEAEPHAFGTLVISGDGEHGTLVVDGLSPLGDEYQYQLWLIRDGQRTSGGVFSVNEEGYAALWIEASEPLASYPAFGVTIEPAGGSPGPTGDKVLGGSL